MEEKFIAAIKGGVIGGVLLAAYAVVQLVVNVINWNMAIPGIGVASTVCGCLSWLVLLVVGVGTGALAVMFGAKALTKLVDAIVASAVAGAIAGIIYAVVIVVIAFIEPFLGFSTYAYTSDIASDLAGSALGSAFLGSVTCLCAPVYVIAIAILAVIGGAIYAALKLKLS